MRRFLTLSATAALCLALAACGSRLEPETVAQAGGGGGGGLTGGGALPAGSTAGGGSTGGSGTTGGSGSTGSSTGTGSAGSSGSTGGSGSSGGRGSGGGGGTAAQGSGENAAAGTVEAGSCDGFKNQTGITDDTITLANVADISGPVPGIFESAQQATRAYVEYFNSTNDICGRKLSVELLDSRADAGADQQAYTKACDEAFAAVGSMGAFDSGGAGTAQSCGLPDIRSTTTTPERRDCATCFAAQSVDPSQVNGAMPRWFAEKFPDAAQHAAVLYINAGAAATNAQFFKNAYAKAGWKVDYFQGIDVAEFNYAPYVQQMKDKGIKLVTYTGPYQNTAKLLDAMQQQGFKPDAFVQDATIYDDRFVQEAGDNGNGVYSWSTTALFDNTAIKEMALYRAWLDQVKPGATPNFFGLYAWSAARLFVEQAVALGGQLDRANLVTAMSKVKDWTGNGLHVPQQVGAKTTATCGAVFQLNGGAWSQVSPGDYMCGALLSGS
ncbi:ABC transporter substrate-binding protein [Nocardioides sp. MAH-18]|uniref:ABC transporter substrate-binding protein n=1 Tax=Nocardioides agri TaxID=2682843 RepID=A0A6L6XRC8_9ACTN|nr:MULTISPECIES: ABC transporter substrate-binding protein [unclassified Nocardioides]MBA2954461.1 ABC transporter substrate-binding protein [Nocardioides sp. CGMCC 1.13656]MVQ49322.1 ABC transporter substrate-binding protein [Nocardioides sp. MAH-18]